MRNLGMDSFGVAMSGVVPRARISCTFLKDTASYNETTCCYNYTTHVDLTEKQLQSIRWWAQHIMCEVHESCQLYSIAKHINGFRIDPSTGTVTMHTSKPLIEKKFKVTIYPITKKGGCIFQGHTFELSFIDEYQIPCGRITYEGKTMKQYTMVFGPNDPIKKMAYMLDFDHAKYDVVLNDTPNELLGFRVEPDNAYVLLGEEIPAHKEYRVLVHIPFLPGYQSS